MGVNGIFYINSERWIHNTGSTFNTFLGRNAGKLTATGSNNTGVGTNSLFSITSGSNNTGFGVNSGFAITTASNNIAIGSNSLTTNLFGNENISIGVGTMATNTSGSNNICIGNSAGETVAISESLFIGSSAGRLVSTGLRNNYIGYSAGRIATTGSDNIALGHKALFTLTTGSSNIALGTNAGNSLDPVSSNNICISNVGNISDSGVTRIGTDGTQTACYIAGIYENLVTNSGIGSPYTLSCVNADAKLGRISTLDVNNQYSITTVSTTPYNIVSTDEYIVSTLSASVSSSITLPLASAGKRKITIIDGGGNALPNIITLNKSGSDTINSGAVYLINYDYGTVTLINDGISAWWAVSNRNQ